DKPVLGLDRPQIHRRRGRKVKAGLLETSMISLQAGCSMRCGHFFFTFCFPGCIKPTSHLESKITLVTLISSEL
ncbi:unnamed protein product, partial [Bubo scandiacus]